MIQLNMRVETGLVMVESGRLEVRICKKDGDGRGFIYCRMLLVNFLVK